VLRILKYLSESLWSKQHEYIIPLFSMATRLSCKVIMKIYTFFTFPLDKNSLQFKAILLYSSVQSCVNTRHLITVASQPSLSRGRMAVQVFFGGAFRRHLKRNCLQNRWRHIGATGPFKTINPQKMFANETRLWRYSCLPYRRKQGCTCTNYFTQARRTIAKQAQNNNFKSFKI